MKIKFLLLFILTGYYLSYTQTKTGTDSLKHYNYEKLEEKFYNYNYDGKPGKAKLIAQYYLAKAKQEKNTSQIAEGYAFMYANENEKDALKYIDSVAVLTKHSTEDAYPARIYLMKANIYFKFNNQKEALNNYIIGLKYARQKNNKRQIALAETNIAYLNSYIGKDAEAAKVLRYYMDNTDYLTENELEKIRVNLADCYIEINQPDSAKILISKGLQTFRKKDDYRYYQYLGLSGFYHLKLKKYRNALNDLTACTTYFLANDDIREKTYALLYLGKSYAELNEKEKAVENFTKIDSIITKTAYIFPELRETYTYLIDYYKDKNDHEKQLYYVERFLKIDQTLDSHFKYVSRELPRLYDTPKLIEEKENILNDLKFKKAFFYISLIILLFAQLIVLCLYYQSKRREKHHKKIAQDLILKAHTKILSGGAAESQKEVSPTPPQADPVKDKNTSIISEDTTQAILKDIETFESKEQFLNKGITLVTLAKKIKTNSKYLSEIINTHKGKNFAAYLNDLRIDYAINRLANDRKFRSYKIPFIAEELGYNNEQAFTMAFKKRTGTPLSIYLKEIEKSEASKKDQ
ncbi:MAG: helix-turn-helix domain-containing protein [Chryseobacterium sp.]|uniref:helix-turn-helix domain-containing protein n=1 Tax=Chryseobacterium sp. TaxID=1871047 RepID=UPI0025C3C750|nr:helix-turn-helix domain-containing protein [Chryseobacterium sp.]MCJ7933137.1 helix-turn-helix domain-containing protein [Chryseobacterium sp.]